jgi:hypothetical protein
MTIQINGSQMIVGGQRMVVVIVRMVQKMITVFMSETVRRSWHGE